MTARTAMGVACLTVLASCSAAGQSRRYVAEHFRTTRTNFVYVRDRVTGHWVNRHCELRAPMARELPNPLVTDESGDLLSVQLFGPESVQTGGLQSVAFEIRDTFRVWVIDDVLHGPDVEGRTSYGVQVSWPRPGQQTRLDPLEMFHLPRLGNEEQDTWSPWVVASSTREGALGWWDEANGAPPAAPLPNAHPFELRCQVVATDTPGVVK